MRIQHGAFAHVDEFRGGRAVRVHVRRVKPLKNGGNDAGWAVLVRVDMDLVVAVFRIVQVEIYLHFLGHTYWTVGLLIVC